MPKSRGRKPPNARGPIKTQSVKGPTSTRNTKRAYAPGTAKRPNDTPKPNPKMGEMVVKQTIVEEIVRSARFKFSATTSVTSGRRATSMYGLTGKSSRPNRA